MFFPFTKGAFAFFLDISKDGGKPAFFLGCSILFLLKTR